MKWAGKAELKIEGSVDGLSRIMSIVEKMYKHGATGHTFDVVAADNMVIETPLGQWDGDGASTVTSMVLTETKTGEFRIANLHDDSLDEEN